MFFRKMMQVNTYNKMLDQNIQSNSNYISRGGNWRGSRGDRGDRGRGFRGSRGFRGRDNGDREDFGDREIEEVYDNDWQQKFKEADDFFNNEFQFKEGNNDKDFNRSGFNQGSQGNQYGEISAYSVNTDYNQDSAYNKFGYKQFNNYSHNNFKYNKNEDNYDEDRERPFQFNNRGGRGFSRPFYKSGHRDFQDREYQGKRNNY